MKLKKGAFANSATGYGKSKHSHNRNNFSPAKDESNKKELTEINEKDLNSGFGDYLKSSEAVEMMKLFVFANSIMLILTMAWPNIKEQYYMFIQWYNSYQTE